MNKKITKPKKNVKNKGRSERLLLLAIMALGVIGLTFTYGNKKPVESNVSASAADTTNSDGKVKADKMILNLNQKERDTQLTKRVTRF